MARRIEPIPLDARGFARDYYAITREGDVYRVIPNQGTWQGRKLSPVQNGNSRYITVHYEGYRAQVDVDMMAYVIFRDPNNRYHRSF